VVFWGEEGGSREYGQGTLVLNYKKWLQAENLQPRYTLYFIKFDDDEGQVHQEQGRKESTVQESSQPMPLGNLMD